MKKALFTIMALLLFVVMISLPYKKAFAQNITIEGTILIAELNQQVVKELPPDSYLIILREFSDKMFILNKSQSIKFGFVSEKPRIIIKSFSSNDKVQINYINKPKEMTYHNNKYIVYKVSSMKIMK